MGLLSLCPPILPSLSQGISSHFHDTYEKGFVECCSLKYVLKEMGKEDYTVPSTEVSGLQPPHL